LDLGVVQAIVLSFFPRFRVKQTSSAHAGQIYIAVINYVRIRPVACIGTLCYLLEPWSPNPC